MTTLVVSDLHLGGRSGVDVLQDPARRAALLDALDGVDRLVLLGDTLELRHGPQREALAAAAPVLAALGARVSEAIVVAGNHDHALVDGWLRRRAQSAPEAMALEQRLAPAEASWAAEQVAGALGVPTAIAYPGLWVRDDVYATHGHLLDAHTTIPTFERLAVGLTVRLTGDLPPGAGVADY
ncbi:MAG TPA: metallophosphoesterase, partial [Capillimicrobium sp.]